MKNHTRPGHRNAGWVFVGLLMLGASAHAGGERSPAAQAPAKLMHKPIVALYEENPWLAVVGADVPTVVLYEDGLAIFHRLEGESVRSFEARLTAAEMQERIGQIFDPGFGEVPAWSQTTSATDQPTVVILRRQGQEWTQKRVYGIGRDGLARHAGADSPPPPAFVSTYLRLQAFDAASKKPWEPEQIEVMLWGFEYAKEAVPWPTKIPAPPDVSPPQNGVVKHLVPARYEAPLREFLSARRQTVAVLHNGHKWSVGIRRKVPEEEDLQAARQKRLR